MCKWCSLVTLQWVVLTGRPMLEATTTVRAEANSMLNPLKKEIHVFTPAMIMHFITRPIG